MDKEVKIIGLTGSLRKKSFNRASLRATLDLLPSNTTLEIIDLSVLPFFNEDVEAIKDPAAVETFKEKMHESDGFLLATPEYNFSIPPVLKNALDWASRGKRDQTPLYDKPAAIMSASIGRLGGVRVQYHLRQVCTSLNLHVVNHPEVFITNAADKFDGMGRLNDERTRKSIGRLLEALVSEIRLRRS